MHVERVSYLVKKLILKLIATYQTLRVIADLTVDNNRFTLVSLYAPNTDSPVFFENIMTKVDSLNNSNPVIYCGDFNLVQDPSLDYHNYKSINNSKAREKLLDMKETYSLIDPFREIYPTLRRYTWRKKHPMKMGRLDFFLISENLHSSVYKCKILPSYRSDHSMIILDLVFTPFKKGKPLWKFNNSLLSDIEYISIIKEKIDEIKSQYSVPVYETDCIKDIQNDQIQFLINDQLFLETLLMEIRGKTISYSSYKKKRK